MMLNLETGNSCPRNGVAARMVPLVKIRKLIINRSYLLTLLSSYLMLLIMPTNLVECSSAMKRLYEDLFSDYNRLILPVAKNKTKVRVSVGLKLGQILDLNLKQQILSTNVWVEQKWHDYKLEWRPEEYDDIEMIHVPAENIWIPDIVLFNNADGNYELTLVAKARVYYNGTVTWNPPTMFRSTCEIDVEFFPFDIQTCYLRFGSWTYAGDEVELSLAHGGNRTKLEDGIDLSQFYKNVEWDIIDVPAYHNEVHYDCCPEPYSDITFKIVIRRKILFYLVNLILPVALMTFLTVSVFYLPSDSNEKVTLSISILTSLIVFFLLMLEIIPPSSLAVPLFGKYLLFTLVLVSLSACVSVYVLNMHHRSPTIHSMSPRMRQLFLKTLPRLLFLNQPDPRERSSLNRFRQKKIAQQLLKQASSPTNKVYDLAQPMAASLNLIETLHKSYQFDPRDDQDDQGRYFRRYVDEYIEQLKKRELNKLHNNGAPQRPIMQMTDNNNNNGSSRYPNKRNRMQESSSCLDSSTTRPVCCSRATFVDHCQTGTLFHQSNSLSHAFNERSTDLLCPPANQTGSGHLMDVGQTNRATTTTQYLGLLNDDTLDMTFDYDDIQDNNGNTAMQAPQGMNQTGHESRRASRAGSRSVRGGPLPVGEELPTPPPPPKSLNQLSMSGRNSSLGLTTQGQSMDEVGSCYDPASTVARCLGPDAHDQVDGAFVDKLMSSIHMLNDDFDTTTSGDSPGMNQNLNNNTSDNQIINNNQYHNSYLNYMREDSRERPLIKPANGQQQQQQENTGIASVNHARRDMRPHSHYTSNHEVSNGLAGNGQNYNKTESSATTTSNTEIPNVPTLNRDFLPGLEAKPSDLLLSLRLPYDRMPAHVRAAIRSILFIADTIKNEDDENSAIEDWESMSMVVDRLFFCIFFLLCTIGTAIILGSAPALYDYRLPVDDRLRFELPPSSNCANRTII